VRYRDDIRRLERLLLLDAGAPRRPRLPRRLVDDHRLSLDGGVPGRQARELSTRSDVVGRLAGADELPTSERGAGEASLLDLLQNDPHGSSVMPSVAVVHPAHARPRLAEQLRFATASDTVT